VAKFSIVLPVHNGGKYVKDCVSSILSQTISDFNLEVLDNCSTDGTLQWLMSLNDPRVRLYPSEKALSIEENWGRIVTIPKNEFMTFIGHDDLLDKDYLSVMIQLIQKHPLAGFYQVHFRYIDATGNKVRSCKPMDEVQSASEFLAFFLSSMSELSIGQAIRSSDYDQIGGIPPYPNLLFADFELWMRLLQKGYRATSSEECCSYRIHPGSTTNSSSIIKYYHSVMKLLDFFILMKSGDKAFGEIFEKYGLGFLKLYGQSIAHHLLRVPKNKRDGITVTGFIDKYKHAIDQLIPNNEYNPEKIYNIRLAKQIDKNFALRESFLILKRIYKTPVLR